MKKFKDPECIAQIMYNNLGATEIEIIRSIDKPEGMVLFHHSVGRHIRNEFLLWHEDNPYTVTNAEPNENGILDHPLHPDQVSHSILEKVWSLVND